MCYIRVCVCVCVSHRHSESVAVPHLKKPWRVRRAQEAERKAMKELERGMKEARDKEKEV